MISLRSKLILTAAPFALTSATLAGISTTVDGGHDAYLIRLGLWILCFGFVVCVVVWDFHRVGEMRRELTLMRDRADAADKRADAAEELVKALIGRLEPLEDELRCREIAKTLLNGDHDVELLRALLHVEDVEKRN
jgi:hypothetical protein